jgi:hypothetical protein
MEKDRAARYATAADLAADLARTRGRVTKRPLPTGDAVIEDTAEESDWALRLFSPKEKSGWTIGMALRFDGRYYRVDEILPPVDSAAEGWTYHLAVWPTSDIFRGVVDYAQDALERKAKEEQTLGKRLKRLFGS